MSEDKGPYFVGMLGGVEVYRCPVKTCGTARKTRREIEAHIADTHPEPTMAQRAARMGLVIARR